MIFGSSLTFADGLIFTPRQIKAAAVPDAPAMLDASSGEALMTTQQAAAFLGLSPRTLEGYRRKGDGPSFVAISRNLVRYRPADLRAWLEGRVAPHTAKARAILGH